MADQRETQDQAVVPLCGPVRVPARVVEHFLGTGLGQLLSGSQPVPPDEFDGDQVTAFRKIFGATPDRNGGHVVEDFSPDELDRLKWDLDYMITANSDGGDPWSLTNIRVARGMLAKIDALLRSSPVEPAVAKAAAMGHTVVWDPPAAMTAARRWTCTRCSATVLDYRGNVYGSATERTCGGGR